MFRTLPVLYTYGCTAFVGYSITSQMHFKSRKAVTVREWPISAANVQKQTKANKDA